MARSKKSKKSSGKGSSRKGRAKKAGGAKKRAAAEPKLYTLTEIGRMASVSMPTLQKYKRKYQDRIPSVGEGRKQRYPREAVAVFRQLKKENLAKRGRPPKSGSKAKAGSRQSASEKSDLLTLTDISRITKISYPTVSRYVKLFLDRIPHVGSGRTRRFPREAVAVFRQLRRESKPGRPAKKAAAKRGGSRSQAALDSRLRRLEKAQADLAKEVSGLAKLIKKPIKVTLRR